MTSQLVSSPQLTFLRFFHVLCLVISAMGYVYPKERDLITLPYDEDGMKSTVIMQFSHGPGGITYLDFSDVVQDPEGRRFEVPRFLKTYTADRILDELKLYVDSDEIWGERVILELLYYSLLFGHDHDPHLGKQDEWSRTPPLKNAQNWMEEVDVCEWEGITCGTVPRELPFKQRRYADHMMSPTHRCSGVPDGVVTSIELSEYGLEGTLPEEIVSLSYLERLVLSRNFLNGTIPEAYGWIQGLSLLDLSDNELSGTIPISITRLSSTLEELWLDENKLEGPLYEEFGALTLLRYLDVGENRLTGTLPTELAKLTKLVGLYVEENRFNGRLPTEYGEFRLLRVLDVDSCNISGTLPSEFGSIPHLIEVFMQNNRIEGSFPSELLRLSHLEYLILDDNRMSGTLPRGEEGSLHSWSRLQSLREFTLARNSFSGTFPDAMPNGLTALTAIDMASNRFTGSLPTELGLWTGLRRLNVRANKFSGTIPSEIGLFENLQLLILSDNRLTGQIPDAVCDLDGYFKQHYGCDSILCPPETFHTEGSASWEGGCRPCPLTDEEKAADPGLARVLGRTSCRNESFVKGDVDADSMLSEWEILLRLFTHTDGENWGHQFEAWLDWDLAACELPGVSCVGSRISKLDLSNAQLCSDGNGNEGPARACYGIPSEIGLLSDLEVLNVPHRQFLRGTFPTEIGLLTKLSYLNIAGSMVSGTIPSEIGRLQNLRVLSIQNCRFHGTLPTEIFALGHLENLSVGINSLTGTIPSEIGSLVSAKEIAMSRCLFHGTIPSSIGLLSTAENIELYSNRLAGTLPSELGACTILRRFDVFNNKLSGSIPESFGSLEGLQVLHLKKNELTGTLPAFFGRLPELLWLDLTSNRLHGTIPPSYGETTTLKDLRLGDNMIYNPIPPSLCTSRIVNGGRTGSSGCDSILCPRGTHTISGFATEREPCFHCPGDKTSIYLGATSCVTVYEEDVLAMIYDVLHGDEWPEEYRYGWKDDDMYYCNWGGITCIDEEIIGINFPIRASDPP